MKIEKKASEVIDDAAKRMESMKEFTPPDWASFVKTGAHKERTPEQPNWWWIRSAAILKKVETGEKIGVSRLRKVYGGRKNKGHKPEHKYKASGSIIRKILQQLEQAGFVMKVKNQGRKITPKGINFLNGKKKSAEDN